MARVRAARVDVATHARDATDATDATTRARALASRPPTGRRADDDDARRRARAVVDGADARDRRARARGAPTRGERDGARRETRRGDDAATATAPIATATGSAMTWMRARADPVRWVMFPGRALEGGAASYDWRGAPFAGDVADPIDASVTYRRTLVALEIRERRAHTSCGGSSAVGDGRTSDGMTTCALRIMRTKGATNGDDRCAGEYFVVYAHGNACDVGDCAMEATKIAVGLKAHVIVPEFPGYGVTEGVAHEESVNAVVKATVKYCVKYLNVSQSRMIIMGRSIGTGPACWITRMMCAQGGPPAGLVLQSPYTSIRDVASGYIGATASYLLADRWNNRENLAEVECPVLVMHGDKDTVIPFSHSQNLLEAMRVANEARAEGEPTRPASMNLFVQEGCEHNTYDAEQHVVLPVMKWVRKRVTPAVIEYLTRKNADERGQKALEPMRCRLAAESFMLKYSNRFKGNNAL
jgi:acetyl esterase/lipase